MGICEGQLLNHQEKNCSHFPGWSFQSYKLTLINETMVRSIPERTIL